jgi:hypothetical protein
MGGMGEMGLQISVNGTQQVDWTATFPDYQTKANYHFWKPYPNFATLTLEAGLQVIKVQLTASHLNLDYIEFALVGPDAGAAGAAGAADGGAGASGAAGTPGTAGASAAGSNGASGTSGAAGASTGAAGATSSTGAAGAVASGAAGAPSGVSGAAGAGPKATHGSSGCALSGARTSRDSWALALATALIALALTRTRA